MKASRRRPRLSKRQFYDRSSDNPGWPGYDVRADMALKECGNAIFDLLREQSALPPHEAHAFATATCRAAFGVLPIGDGLNAVSDERCALSCLSSRLPGPRSWSWRPCWRSASDQTRDSVLSAGFREAPAACGRRFSIRALRLVS